MHHRFQGTVVFETGRRRAHPYADRSKAGFSSPHLDSVHVMVSGRVVHGVSHSWAHEVDRALVAILDAYPDLRHVAIRVPKQDGDVRRVFHSADGVNWKQVHFHAIGTNYPFHIDHIIAGAKELDGDPAFRADLSLTSLRLRQLTGEMLADGSHSSIAAWAEARLRKVLDHAGLLYVEGPRSEEAREGRRVALMAIERVILRLRQGLASNAPFRSELQLEQTISSLMEYFIARHVPFLMTPKLLLRPFDHLSRSARDSLAKAVWAEAAGLDRDQNFRTISGTLLARAEGRLDQDGGDDAYRQLEAMLAEDLAAGYRVARLEDRVFIFSRGRWRAASATTPEGKPCWSEGLIVSRNDGRLIVPPHLRDGRIAHGYTRNGPGEGPARPQPAIELRCIERPVTGTNLAWLHAWHAWDLRRG